MVYPHGQGGWKVKPVRTFFGQGGIIVLRFCADVFYGRPLILFSDYFYDLNASKKLTKYAQMVSPFGNRDIKKYGIEKKSNFKTHLVDRDKRCKMY